MIHEQGGRARSTRTAGEIEELLRKEMNNLTEDERAALEVMLDELKKGQTKGGLYEALHKTEYKVQPVSMEQFVKDEYYLGKTCDTLYPKLLEDLTELFSGGYNESIWTGSIGYGKTFAASIGVCRVLYEISCLQDPFTTFGLAKDSNVSIVCLSVNEALAVKVAFENIATKIKASAYFQEHFAFTPTKKELRFPNNIWVAARATTDTSALGLNAVGCIMDECLHPDSLVLLADGQQGRVADLWRNGGQAVVASFDFQKNEAVSATAFIKPSTEQECFELTLSNGLVLRASWRHPVAVRRGGVWKFITVRDILDGEEVLTYAPMDSRGEGCSCRADAAAPRGGKIEGAFAGDDSAGCGGGSEEAGRGEDAQASLLAREGQSEFREAPVRGTQACGQPGEQGPQVVFRSASADVDSAEGETCSHGEVQTGVGGTQQATDGCFQAQRGNEKEDLRVECLEVEERRLPVSGSYFHDESGEGRIPILLGVTGNRDARSRPLSHWVHLRKAGSPLYVAGVLALDVAGLSSAAAWWLGDRRRGEAERVHVQSEGARQDERRSALLRGARLEVRSLGRALAVARLVSKKNLGVQPTYDVSVPGYEVLVADGVLVHNTNFMPTKGKVAERMGYLDHAEVIYNSIQRRMKSRLLKKGRMPGMLFIVSSKKTNDDFTARRIRASRDDATVFVRDYALWDVKRENYSSETFSVVVGSDQTPSRILEPMEVVPFKAKPPENCLLLDVPEDFRPDFESDLEGAIRDLAGCATVAISPFIHRREKILEAVQQDIKLYGPNRHPFSVMTYDPSKGGSFVWEKMIKDVEERQMMGPVATLRRPIIDPSAPRHIHIDPALRNDALGFCMAHISKWVDVVRRSELGQYMERAPVYVVDLLLQVTPPAGDEIILGDIRRLIYELSAHGYMITNVSLDSFQCVAAGTRVNTSRGLLPIEEVRVGDIVHSRTGPAAVEKTWSFGEQDTLRIVTKDGDELEGTGKHRIEVAVGRELRADESGETRWLPVWEWCRLDALKVGDVVRLTESPVAVDAGAPVELFGEPESLGRGAGGFPGRLAMWSPPTVLTAALAEWLGVVWGDGHVREDGVEVTVTEEESECAVRVFDRLFGSVFEYHSRSDKFGTISVSGRWFTRWLAANGLVKPLIPEAILRSPRTIKRAFLRGLFATDGSVGRVCGNVSLSTKHRELARQVQVLLRTDFGIASCLTTIERGYEGDYVESGVQYVVSVRGSRSDFAERVGFSYRRKQQLLETFRDVQGRDLKFKSKVVAILPGRASVFDLQVAGDPSYIANGFVSHNSRDTLQQLQQKGFNAEMVSVDTSLEPYDTLKTALYENRLFVYDYPVLTKELQQLEKDALRRKVDHPPKGCFVGHTRIPLLDGTFPQIEELAGKEVWVYSSTPEGHIVPGRARGRFTKNVTELVDVVLDSGAVERCTPEHRWMLRDGSYKEARLLRPGIDRLMPINRVWPVNGGYERLTDLNGKQTLTHHMVWEALNGPLPEGFCVHHENLTKTDNRPENLSAETLNEHARAHTSLRHANDLEWRTKLYDGAQKFNLSVEGRKKHSEALKRTLRKMTPEQRRARAALHPDFRSDIDRSRLELVRGDSGAENANAVARLLGCGRNVVVRVLREHGFNSWDDFKAAPAGNNHKVRAVIPVVLSEPVAVFDLEVDQWSNFALASGAFVHNSKDCADALAGVCYTLLRDRTHQPLPILRGVSVYGDAWMPEQRQARMAGDVAAERNMDLQDYGMLPPFLSGGGGRDGEF